VRSAEEQKIRRGEEEVELGRGEDQKLRAG
jgi:hypothetical protein